MKRLKVALGFERLSDGNLSSLANSVITSMSGKPEFNNPPVAFAAAENALDTFNAAVSAAMYGGIALTAAKNAARETLLSILRKLAVYVQMVADQDMALLLSSGFSAISVSRARTILDAPTVISVDNEGTTKFTVRLRSVSNARSYEVRAINGATTPASSVFSTKARRIILGNLTSGTTYTVQARAIGGSTGYSEWCDPVSHMAI